MYEFEALCSAWTFAVFWWISRQDWTPRAGQGNMNLATWSCLIMSWLTVINQCSESNTQSPLALPTIPSAGEKSRHRLKDSNGYIVKFLWLKGCPEQFWNCHIVKFRVVKVLVSMATYYIADGTLKDVEFHGVFMMKLTTPFFSKKKTGNTPSLTNEQNSFT